MFILNKMVTRLRGHNRTLCSLDSRLDELKVNQGKILGELYRLKNSSNIQDYEFKIFSQWGEDGIIQKLVSCIEIKNKTFIEFGVQDFTESNCRYLMMNDNWSGFVIDGATENIERLKSSYYYHQYQIDSLAAFITRENINELLRQSRFERDLGILCIDLDGVDYYIYEAIEEFYPRILILEYNAVFGKNRKIAVPYDAAFFRTTNHFPNLYYGASLAAMEYLAAKKGYTLVGTTSSGGNAFFVRNDLMNSELRARTANEAFSDSTSRESRDASGKLTHVGGSDRLAIIRGLPVFNVESAQNETI